MVVVTLYLSMPLCMVILELFRSALLLRGNRPIYLCSFHYHVRVSSLLLPLYEYHQL